MTYNLKLSETLSKKIKGYETIVTRSMATDAIKKIYAFLDDKKKKSSYLEDDVEYIEYNESFNTDDSLCDLLKSIFVVMTRIRWVTITIEYIENAFFFNNLFLIPNEKTAKRIDQIGKEYSTEIGCVEMFEIQEMRRKLADGDYYDEWLDANFKVPDIREIKKNRPSLDVLKETLSYIKSEYVELAFAHNFALCALENYDISSAKIFISEDIASIRNVDFLK